MKPSLRPHCPALSEAALWVRFFTAAEAPARLSMYSNSQWEFSDEGRSSQAQLPNSFEPSLALACQCSLPCHYYLMCLRGVHSCAVPAWLPGSSLPFLPIRRAGYPRAALRPWRRPDRALSHSGWSRCGFSAELAHSSGPDSWGRLASPQGPTQQTKGFEAVGLSRTCLNV